MPAIYEKPKRSIVPQSRRYVAAAGGQALKRARQKHQGLSSDEIDRIVVGVTGRLAGQLRGLRIVVRQDGVVLHGCVRSYYAKQLVQEAVMNATDVPITENAIEVV